MVPRWLGRLSWLKVALVFHTTWEASDRSVEHANAWGLERRTTTGIKIIAVDEVRSERGHHCITLVHQINAGAKRLLWIGLDRTKSADFFRNLNRQRDEELDPRSMQRHVEAVSQRVSLRDFKYGSRSQPVPHHANDE